MSVKDLAKDVENLPSIGKTGVPAPAAAPIEAPATDAPTIRYDLAALLGRWESLPENVGTAISALASA